MTASRQTKFWQHVKRSLTEHQHSNYTIKNGQTTGGSLINFQSGLQELKQILKV